MTFLSGVVVFSLYKDLVGNIASKILFGKIFKLNLTIWKKALSEDR
jgi:hypothetical protein